MVSRGMTKQHLLDNIKEKDYPFTTTTPYINPALRILKKLELINTFSEKPKLKTKFAMEDAKETVQKLEKRVRMSSTDKLRLERAEKILGKKNEDAHPLYVFLTENGEKEITNFVGWGRGIKWSHYRRALMKHPNIYDVMDEYPKYTWINGDKQSTTFT